MVTARPLALVATATLALALSACGGSESTSADSATNSSSSPSATSTSSSSSPSASSSENSATESASASPSSTASSTSANSTGAAAPLTGAAGNGPATRRVAVWPNASWHIENVNQDLCDMGMNGSSGEISGYSLSRTSFTCGPTAAGLLACKKDAKGNALCIVNYDQRRAVRFRTGLTRFDPNNVEPQPLQVKLTNGVTCSTVSHDQAHHYGDRMSWLWCGDNDVLLLPPGDNGNQGAYFDKSKPQWTAQYSVNNAAPKTVGVARVTYAR